MFEDRRDAGQKLGQTLSKYRDKNVLVLGIPKGGVEVGIEIARGLNADFAILVARKLPFPDDPEAGFGAVAEDGSMYLVQGATAWLPSVTIQRIVRQQKREIVRRIDVLRKGQPLPEIWGRTVILVDDGIAMGSTMRASISMCKRQGAARIVVAVPVTGRDRAREVGSLVDEIVVLEMPPGFRAVAQAYRNWYDVSDEEVLDIIEKWKREH